MAHPPQSTEPKDIRILFRPFAISQCLESKKSKLKTIKTILLKIFSCVLSLAYIIQILFVWFNKKHEYNYIIQMNSMKTLQKRTEPYTEPKVKFSKN